MVTKISDKSVGNTLDNNEWNWLVDLTDSTGVANANIHFTIADGNGSVGIQVTNNDTSNNPITVRVNNTTTNRGLFLNQDGNGIALDIDSESTSARTFQCESVQTSGDVWYIRNQGAHVSTNQFSFINDNTSTTGNVMRLFNNGVGACLLLDHNNTGNAINIDADSNSASDNVGIFMNINNAGAGGEYAFSFNGAEYTASAVGGTQNRKIRIQIGGTDYFIPAYTT